MNKTNLLLKIFLVTTIIVVFGACADDEGIEVVSDKNSRVSTTHTIPMTLVGDVIPFDAKSVTRASNASWIDGDKIYLTFYNGNTKVPGIATYYASSGWLVSYDGNLTVGTEMKCEALHFKNTTDGSASLVSLNYDSEIYEDVNGKYSYIDGSLIVYASLLPKTGRIRFKGSEGSILYITGLTTYNSFSPGNSIFTSLTKMIKVTVASDGYTPYIYGLFTNEDLNLGIIYDDCAFTRTCTADMLKAGVSGYMAIPSESSHNNWQTGLCIKAKGVEYKMIPVAGFETGLFLIGETEVTEALYYTLSGKPSSSQLPISGLTYTQAKEFTQIISNNTKLNFDLPSTNQWFYAAEGGNKSQGYIYSGSNNPDEVAWYSENTTMRQNVKLKVPNELGIYDMSGNVSEWSNKWVRTKDEGATYQCAWRRHGGYYGSTVDQIKSNSFVTNFVKDFSSESEAEECTLLDNTFYEGSGIRLVINVE